ncbi:MAG: DNA mismatch repair protein MutS, partial [Actinobacteria bacterium]|nr:DNA mismatch repair protein MutS [Actinomycetota bacterium]
MPVSVSERTFAGLLSPHPTASLPGTDTSGQDFLADLNLDQIISAVAGDREQQELIKRVLHRQVHDVDTLRYRQEIFRDLEDSDLLAALGQFGDRMRDVRVHQSGLSKMYSARQQQGWFLDAAAIYCDAVGSLAAGLGRLQVCSRGLLAFREYLAKYAASPAFTELDSDTSSRKDDLAKLTYLVRIKGPRVELRRYEGEPNYSAEIEETFARFAQGESKDYRLHYRSWPGMTHVGARILDLVAKLFPAEFTKLDEYRRRHAAFVDPVIDQVDRELQFYLAYLEYTAPVRAARLQFCYPDVTADAKDVLASDTFDLALAAKLAAARTNVVTNEFHLAGPERVIVVSGPNQGGKTTFARSFGQLHHLAAVGCPVPGSAARLFLADKILTHFEREEDITDQTGRLEDDLLRIQRALLAATPDSIVIMNEIFASTTLSDARFLGDKALTKIIELDLLCVYVTFVDELATRGPTVVSMTSMVVPTNPAERTYKVIRKPADGLAYALAIADKHQVTYEHLKKRLS